MKKRFFSKHAKSSAALVSLGIHALIVIVAISFVAVTVITKEEQAFEAKPVKRPKMQLKKLQVPVNVKKKKTQKPKLRKRIVVKPKLNQNTPDIKMPEITGVKGGMGSAGDGLGGAGGIGFAMPEIEIFGIKGKGEKVVIILGSKPTMMRDEIGGISAFTIIKDEVIRIVEELPPTALFNVIVYDWSADALAFPGLVPANDVNAAKLKEWLDPLNATRANMGDNDYGIKTLGPGGVKSSDILVAGKFEDLRKVKATSDKIDCRDWYRSAMIAHKLQADTIFVLTDTWSLQRVQIASAGKNGEDWSKSAAGIKWRESHQKGLRMLDEENKSRRAAGKPPKVLGRGSWDINREYFPDIQRPPTGSYYGFTPKDFVEAFHLIRQRYAPQTSLSRSGLGKKKSSKKDFSYNVIQFVPGGEGADARDVERFKGITNYGNGEYKTISGLEEVRSYAAPQQSP